MKILVDADACPKAIKQILYKAAHQRKVTCIFIANHPLYHPPSPFIKSKLVDKGFDVADQLIVDMVKPHDLVITGDIPLANDAIQQQATVITPQGKKYTKANIGQALSMRDFFTTMRDAGVVETKTKPFSHAQTHRFASELDRYLHIHLNKKT
ncbi:YaiI/YqxD family protein [Facilibium subflavum]|uniref:YaiI/YqxD family protein n=1 Tax=Facilibium subflavum TaxID=2219058 RepID=UPI000E64B387|nr:YaiI/YqxD family protein [Facilibium subflavum]